MFTIKETTHKPTILTTHPIKLKSKKVVEENTTTTPDEKLNITEQLAVNHITEKDSIVILPTVLKKEEKVLANNIKEQAPVLTIGGFLKKEASKKILQEETTSTKQSLEVVVADLAVKVAGKKGGMKKNKNDEGEVKEYALSIGKFSISRKVKN